MHTVNLPHGNITYQTSDDIKLTLKSGTLFSDLATNICHVFYRMLHVEEAVLASSIAGFLVASFSLG